MDMSTEIPGQVYLCQVSETISCGACCGLYNIPHLSRPHLESLLQDRTARFRFIPRTEDDLDDFALQELRCLGDDRPYPHFHHCPFLGLIGAHQSRVGCLLHPLIPENKGLDLRGYSYYGAAACRLYFCPVSYRLPARYKLVVQTTAPNWYIYGLLITEHRLLQALFADLENRLGRKITANDFQTGTSAAQHIQPLLELKETWPYRSARSPGPCHYVFEDGEYMRPGTRYPRMLTGTSRFSTILDELDSAFDSERSMRRAEAELESLLASVAAALA
ncbi:hypothetical protein [Desulfovermiculus halophilus]|jgi:hypothetical protein|uniref:hypothetical protein n=1 Tax=Desulfovermiculus halophilus TaxID=339722 RepID=UPI000489B19F|nr:hypothetical protein [Desulfovermiculus halophilus]